MAEFLVRAVLPLKTGLPEDVVVNSFALRTPGTPPGPNTTAIISNFYNLAVSAQLGALGEWLSPALSQQAKLEMYAVDLATGTIGSPLGVQPFTLLTGIGADSQLPNEVALCVSFAGFPLPGASPARYKGRVFVGPLIKDAVQQDPATVQPILDPDLRQCAAAAAKRMADELVADGTELCVWSRADAAYHPVVRGWVDSELDTQRRRGRRTTVRTTWVLGP